MFSFLKSLFKPDKPSPSYPELPKVSDDGESNISGLYLLGDVAGSPLVKVGLNNGYKLANTLSEKLKKYPQAKSECDYDVIIAGAGVSGVATGLRLHEQGFKVAIFESEDTFQTLRNFTKGKILYAEPEMMELKGDIPFVEGQTEEAINKFATIISEKKLNIITQEKVVDVNKNISGFKVITEKNQNGYQCQYVVIAIGKAGSPRKANVPGEKTHHTKVLHTLKNPADYAGKDVLIYGGGDVALEAAISLAENSKVTIAYRGRSFNRPKVRNIEALTNLEHEGKIKIKFNSILTEIKEAKALLQDNDNKKITELKNDYVFEMLGNVPPVSFFKRIGVEMESVWNLKRYATLVFSFIAVYLLYAWKKGKAPFVVAGQGIENLPSIFSNTSFWYSALYTTLMIIFGIKAMKRWNRQGKDRYQTYRFLSLITFQLMSFLLIECILAVFLPSNTWWRAYAINNPFPLLFDSFYNMTGVSATDLRWGFVGVGAIITFVIIPIAVRWHGKRFCTWICGCGGLAETFGDRWRHLSLKGAKSRRWEFMGSIIMFWAFLSAGVILFVYNGNTTDAGKWHGAYSLLVDFWFVAVIPVTLYPIWGGKVWCRYWCPLAKYMQILSSWYGRLEIISNEHCIQCGKCSRYCQVGVDVMEFAKNQKSFSNKNSSCIHCGICITVCPMNVLKFNNEKKDD